MRRRKASPEVLERLTEFGRRLLSAHSDLSGSHCPLCGHTGMLAEFDQGHMLLYCDAPPRDPETEKSLCGYQFVVHRTSVDALPKPVWKRLVEAPKPAVKKTPPRKVRR
jgi:ssDNA-binding Zn-finger/Zn-ribbon topoisomerase 1